VRIPAQLPDCLRNSGFLPSLGHISEHRDYTGTAYVPLDQQICDSVQSLGLLKKMEITQHYYDKEEFSSSISKKVLAIPVWYRYSSGSCLLEMMQL